MKKTGMKRARREVNELGQKRRRGEAAVRGGRGGGMGIREVARKIERRRKAEERHEAEMERRSDERR